ncbi:hypothetical protein [Actinomadura latina]|uniref:Uncharacterized protein n=1 Tax=Actinomadura latina TaxID=163603 RepID=A0A846YUE6_9ACTN|nr:hypothetical protein [Actinomadura latina]NKZ03347.1 hypothetical protein [Actinomadura latina]
MFDIVGSVPLSPVPSRLSVLASLTGLAPTPLPRSAHDGTHRGTTQNPPLIGGVLGAGLYKVLIGRFLPAAEELPREIAEPEPQYETA